ncbi:MAG: hypothetical protein H7145_21270, partial [Akkermansiaceae bacterium]|nr:hypothetical protein [Armatimonadota bacterium]
MNETITVLGRASIQGGIALLVVYLLCRVLHRLSPDLRCWLWRAAYGKCLAGLFVAASVAVPVLPRAALVQATPPIRTMRETATVSRVDEKERTPRSVAERPAGNSPAIPVVESAPVPPLAVAAPTTTTPAVAAAAPLPLAKPSWQSCLVLVYALGVAAGVTRFAVAAFHTRQLVRRAVSIEHPALAELSRRFGRKNIPRLARSAEVGSPLLAFGTILLPGESAGDESLILAHELAHLRRGDLA